MHRKLLAASVAAILFASCFTPSESEQAKANVREAAEAARTATNGTPAAPFVTIGEAVALAAISLLTGGAAENVRQRRRQKKEGRA